MPSLILHEPPGFGIVCLPNQVPDPPLRVAEPGEGAKALRVGEQHCRPLSGLCLLKIRLPAGGFGAVELNRFMGAVAEWFIAGLAATAQRVLRLRGVFPPFLVVQRFALRIGHDGLLAERQAAAYEVGTIFGDLDFRVQVSAHEHQGNTPAGFVTEMAATRSPFVVHAVCQANRMNPDVVKYGLDTEEVLVEELTT